MVELAEKVSFLEELMQRVAYTQIQANMSIERLASEMVDFKDEMRDFKDEMSDFKADESYSQFDINLLWGITCIVSP